MTGFHPAPVMRSALLFLLGVTLFSAALRAADPPPVRIMPLGDSMTLGFSVPTYFSGYRDLLYALLDDEGYQVEFVGTLLDTQNPSIPDPDHEGHGGFRIDQIDSGIESWLNLIDEPDVILLMIGTNDFWQDYQTATAANRLASLVTKIAELRPFARILLTTLPPRTDSATLEAAQIQFNTAIGGIVAQQQSAGRQVYFVDIHQHLGPGDLSSDGVHPNQAGYDKIANVWADAVIAVISPYGTDEPPAIAHVDPIDLQHVAITFSKPVEDAAADPAHFALSGGKSVLGADLDPVANRVITLTTNPLSPSTSYTLSVSGVRDRTPAHHPIASGTQTSFTAPLLANGSFEFDYTGWTVTGHQVLAGDVAYPPYQGRRMLVFNGGSTSPNGTAAQTFPTTPGQIYRLQFAMGVKAFGSVQQRLQCVVQGTGPLLSQTLSITGTSGGALVWSQKSLTFVADSASATVTFTDVSTTTNNADLLLDQVQVDPQAVQTLSVASSPATGVSIIVSPADVNGASNGTTNFTRQYDSGATVSLTAPPNAGGNTFLKWQRDGSDYSTSTAIGVTMSASHTLTAIYAPPAPVITQQPQSLTAPTGAAATFSVSATGSGLMYQWKRDGTAIADATNSTYTINAVQSSHAGNYTVTVSTAGGTTTSAPAALTVLTSGVLANGSFESDLTSWTATGNQTVISISPYTPTHGQNLVVFNGGQTSPNGILTQRVTTTPGQTYTLNFDVGAFAYNTNEQRLRVTVEGASTLVSQTVSVKGLGGGATKWVAKTYTFTADSEVTTLTFADVSTNTNSIDLLLDHVVVTAHTSHTLTIASSPNAGISIGASPADTNGSSGGSTPFSRTYAGGTVVNLTAPGVVAGATFEKWQLDGDDYSTSASINVTLDADATFTAVYTAPQPFTNGSFESDYTAWSASGHQIIMGNDFYATTDGTSVLVFNGGQSSPNGVVAQTFATSPGQTYTLRFDMGVLAYNTNAQRLGVTVTGAATLLSQTITLNGLGGGATRWAAQTFTFTADSAVTTLTFTDASTTSQNLDLLLDNVRVNAVSPRTLTISSNPAAGTAISVSPGDHHGESDGVTPFTREYSEGATVTLTAPASAESSVFSKWTRDGVDYSSSRSIVVTADDDRDFTAVYSSAAGFANGSFESGYTGWSTSGNQFLADDGSYQTTDGSTVVVFNGGQSAPNGTLTQTFATTPGQLYSLQYDVGVYSFNTSAQKLKVTVQGGTLLLSQTTTLNGLAGGSTRWAAQSHSFVADSGITTLTFTDVSTTSHNLDLMLDNVRVTP